MDSETTTDFLKKTKQEVEDFDSKTTNNIYKTIQWSFCMEKKWEFTGFLLLSLIIIPLQFTFIPKTVTQLTEGLVLIKNDMTATQKTNIIWAIAIISISWIIVTIIQLGKNSIELSLLPTHIQHIREKLFNQLIERYSTDYNDVPAGESIIRILDVSRLFAYQSQYVLTKIIPYIIGLIVVIVYAFTVNRTLGCIILIGLLMVTANVSFYAFRISRKSNSREKVYMGMAQKMNDKFDNLMNIYINNDENNASKQYKDLNGEHTRKWQIEMTDSRNCKAIVSALTVITFLVVLFVGFSKVKNKQLTGIQYASLITVFIVYMNRSMKMFMLIPYLARQYGIWLNNFPFVHNLFKEIEKSQSNRPIIKGTIDLIDVEFNYPEESIQVFNKLNLSVQEGERVAIVGRSGSGKSTLMKLILGLYRPTKGTIKISGSDVRDISLKEVRNKVTYINQRTTLMDESILNNIQFGNSATKEEILALLKKYDLSTIFSDIGGIESSAGVNGGNLSLGMQKVVILLRGILRQGALIYLIDEPLSGLDTASRSKVTKMIQEELEGKTIVYVTHNEEIFEYVDRVISIQK